jgi:holin (3TMs family)
MSFISDIFAGGAEGILKGARDVVSAFKADPLELAKIESEFVKAEMNLTLGMSQAQTRINEIEAASQDKFVSRWRPAIGWICGAAYGYHFVLQPFAVFLLAVSGYHIAAELPSIPVSELSVVLMGLLGLGALRTYEKINQK